MLGEDSGLKQKILEKLLDLFSTLEESGESPEKEALEGQDDAEPKADLTVLGIGGGPMEEKKKGII